MKQIRIYLCTVRGISNEVLSKYFELKFKEKTI